MIIRLAFGTSLAAAAGAALAGGVTATGIEEVVVTAGRITLGGDPRAASEGTVLHEQLDNRPILRTGEVLEVVPGLIVTQHTGDGKANQYFLRGFNLDHGTDFLTRVEGMPINMPTHGHGQGYLDLNFVIPELMERVDYHKGTYYPELGNFSAAGAAEVGYFDRLRPFVALTGGEDAYLRTVAAGSLPLAGGDLLLAFERNSTDGPWKQPQDLRKANGVARYARETDGGRWSVGAMVHHGEWTATDQVPRRAVQDGRIGRFGFVDPTSGGATHRYSLSLQGDHAFGGRQFEYSAWALDYRLRLFSNFTYALDAVNGDQFEQFDDRRAGGGSVAWSQPLAGDGRWALRTGLEVRHDDIDPVGLFRTTARERHATIREDAVRQTQAGAWVALETQWTEWFRSEGGLRYDRVAYDVESDLVANSGSGSGDLVSPKLTLVLGPWRASEFFVAAGQGFHGNDVRGATIAVDPVDGVTPVEQVTPLVGADGVEVGLRTSLVPRTQLSLALWQLEIDSELLFVGDGGTTEANRPSRRRGVELGVYARPMEWMIVDADFAWSEPRFRDDAAAGNRIPGAVERVASLGVTLDHRSGWFGGARVRYLGPAALIEDDSVRAPSSTLVNLEAGRRFGERMRVALGLFNALDRDASDIRYLYESQIPGEPAPVRDIHFHPAEPRTLRLTVAMAL
jgi:outer membrane receptor protein involved in Fe transport